MKTITADKYTMSFFVDTEHGSNLDFVISDTGWRLKEDGDHYLNHLTKTIDKWLSRFKEASVKETSCYGAVRVTVEFSNISELSAIKTACALAIDDWTKKYRINHMKQDSN